MSPTHMAAFSVSALCRLYRLPGSVTQDSWRAGQVFVSWVKTFGQTSTELLLLHPYCWCGFITGSLINVGQGDADPCPLSPTLPSLCM